jgi:hypothetical protein
MVRQGDVSLINDETARNLLESRTLARFAYNWSDGTPRVVPVWFTWTGDEIVIGSPPRAPKLRALKSGQRVALTVDTDEQPFQVLMIRGPVSVTMSDGITPEYAAAALRYMGEEEGRSWIAALSGRFTRWARIAVRPEWVGVLDFVTRFPSGLVHQG